MCNINSSAMSTNYYAQYVLVNEDTGSVVWYENHDTAIQAQRSTGGVIYNTETTDSDTLDRVLYHARQRMGIE